MAATNSLIKSNAIKAAVTEFLTTATYKDWNIVQTFAQRSLEDIVAALPVTENTIFINFDKANTYTYESGSCGLEASNYTIYFVSIELNGDNMPEKLIVTSEEFLENIDDFLRNFYFDGYDNDIMNGNFCYTKLDIKY